MMPDNLRKTRNIIIFNLLVIELGKWNTLIDSHNDALYDDWTH